MSRQFADEDWAAVIEAFNAALWSQGVAPSNSCQINDIRPKGPKLWSFFSDKNKYQQVPPPPKETA